ncbi:MAG TPA: copper resistance protein CopC [Spirillospora sp.]
MRRVGAIGAVLALSLAVASPASAHDSLTGSSPKKDATVESPAEIELTFSGAVRLPRVIVTDASDRQYQSGSPKAVDNTVTQAIGGTLPNGRYTVAWRVVSSDGHPIQGTYTFTVKGSPAGAAAPSSAPAEPAAPEPSPSNAGAAGETGGASGWLWIGAIALVIVAAVGAVVWLRRSPTTGG